MQNSPMVKYCGIAFCILLVCAELTSSAPSYGDYESIRDLYELLLQREAMEEQSNLPHTLVRKSNRSPSLRLRFGKRSDQYLTNPHYIAGHPVHILEDVAEN